VRYERGFERGSDRDAIVLVVHRANNAESQRVSAQLVRALGRVRSLGGRPLRVLRHAYEDEAALRTELDRRTPTVVYFSAGFGRDIPAITRAVGTRNVITVSAVGRDVDRGIVIGFELSSSRPQIAINFGRARRQDLEFSAQLLRLARVVR
jgi:hypothetical protein